MAPQMNQPLLDYFYPVMPDSTWVERVLSHGAKTVQLRFKGEDPNQIKREIANAIALGEHHKATVIINDHWQEALSLGASFLHLGQEDLAAADLRAIKNAELKLGLSTHDENELAIANAAQPDYIALGPIYETKLKKMKWAPQGLDKITKWKEQISCPLVAIGGFNLARAQGALSAGADSVAVVSDIIQASDPAAHIARWCALSLKTA